MEYFSAGYFNLVHTQEAVSWTDIFVVPAGIWFGQSVDRRIADGSTPVVWNAFACVPVVIRTVGAVCSRVSAISVEETGRRKTLMMY